MQTLQTVSLTDGTTGAPIEVTVLTAQVAQGVALDDSILHAAILTPSTRVARGRRGEHLLFFFYPPLAETRDLCWELRGLVTQVYWSTPGSVTAALRRAISAAGRHLFEHNLNSDPSDRCYGGLSCAILRHNDVFLGQTGPVWACILHDDQLTFFWRGGELTDLGIGPVPAVRLDHISTSPGDTLLIASPSLSRAADMQGLREVLSTEEVSGIAEGLGQFAARVGFAAIVVRWDGPTTAETLGAEATLEADRPRSGVPAVDAGRTARAVPERSEPSPSIAAMRPAVPRQDPEQQTTTQPPGTAVNVLVRSILPKMTSGLRWASRGLGHVWHAVAALGAGMVALGKMLLSAVGTTILATLPGSQRTRARSVHRRPPPQENRTISVAVAIAIPLLVVMVVALAYAQLATQSRFDSIIQQAESRIAQAQVLGDDSAEARLHWEEALQQIETAIALQPDQPHAQVLRQQARRALDQFDGVVRLTLVELADFGSSSVERRLVLGRHAAFVLDSKEGWAAQVAPTGGDDGTEAREVLVLVNSGQRVGGRRVDRLVDCVWVSQQGGRQSSTLFVLDADGGLVSYDPAWETEAGLPQLSRVELSPPLPMRSVAVGSYQGQFYVLDTGATNGGQIWRYRPRGNAYPEPPEPYFEAPPERDLAGAVDMAIDGHIYVLYDDGTVEKFLGGQRVPFEIQGQPGEIQQIGGFALDPRGSGTVYIADRSNNRIIELHPDGSFKAQLLPDDGFVALEAVAISSAADRLYVLDDGRLYTASLP